MVSGDVIRGFPDDGQVVDDGIRSVLIAFPSAS